MISPIEYSARKYRVYGLIPLAPERRHFPGRFRPGLIEASYFSHGFGAKIDVFQGDSAPFSLKRDIVMAALTDSDKPLITGVAWKKRSRLGFELSAFCLQLKLESLSW